MTNVLITGGAGFIGSNFVRYALREHTAIRVINFDKLTYAGNLENLADVALDARYSFVKGDICVRGEVEKAFSEYDIDTVVHFAAESHVDRSILGPAPFIQTNVVGTHVLLEVAKDRGVERFVHVSTDEVYGSLGAAGKFTESTSLHPNSPYAASKASSDLLVLAYHHTFRLPAVVTRCSNNYGPYQFPEKLIPLMVVNALNDKPLPLYGDGMHVRDWLYVEDHCAAIDAVLRRGTIGGVYNIGGDNEWRNIDIVRTILQILQKPESLITFVKDRAGHDRRYAMDATRMRNELGWKPAHSFERGLADTVGWYLKNKEWWTRVMTGEYLDYYRKQYSDA